MTQREGQRRTKGRNGERRKRHKTLFSGFLDIDLMLKVHLAVTLFPHSPSDVLRKQQVMAMMSKVGISSRTYADGRWECCQTMKKRRVWRKKEGEREGGAWKKMDERRKRRGRNGE